MYRVQYFETLCAPPIREQADRNVAVKSVGTKGLTRTGVNNESKGVGAKSQHPKDPKQTPKSRKGRGSQDEDKIREWERDAYEEEAVGELMKSI